jgi:hypothetical protein
MKRFKVVGMFLVAAFALSAMMAAGASAAEPEFLTKTVVKEGANIPLTGTLGAAFLEGEVSKSKITCTGGTTTAVVTGPTRVKEVVATFTGCEASGFPCESGATEGTIATNVLEGVLGNVKSTVPGVRLFSEAGGRGAELAAFSCAGGAIPVKVKGSVIGQLSGAKGEDEKTGKLIATHKMTFTEKAGKQHWVKFIEGPEAGEEEQLEAKVGEGEFEKSGQSVISALKTVPTTWEIGVTK